MRHTPVMPMEPFKQLFYKWGVNENLSLWALRLKVVTLCAFSLMLRLSDIAPRSVSGVDEMWQNQFKRSWVEF